MSFTTTTPGIFVCRWPRFRGLQWMLALLPAFAAITRGQTEQDTRSETNTITSTSPMIVETADGGVYGQLVVAPEIVSSDIQGDLVYTITDEPLHGQVGLAGGDDTDFFQNKTARLGYFAYRAGEDFAGEDSFSYSVRN